MGVGDSRAVLLHALTTMHICKQMGIDTKEVNAMMALEATYCKLNSVKMEYTLLVKTTRKNTTDLKGKEC